MVIAAWDLSLSTDELSEIEPNTVQADELLTVVLIGFSTLTLERPLRAWANVILLSPVFQICEIDLSAPDWLASGYSEPANPGEDGENGCPGAPGGNLIAVCRELRDADRVSELWKSTGQRGGEGQSAGDGIDGEDAVYDVARFKEDIERIVENVPSLIEWGQIPRKPDNGFEVLSRSRVKMPPNEIQMLCATVGSAMVALATQGFLAGDLVAASAVLPVGFALIDIGFRRKTETKLAILRRSESGKPGTPPGKIGRGGCGGYGGLFCLVQAGEESKWRGNAGPDGEPGSPGLPSRDGDGSIAVRGSVMLTYDSSGKLYGNPAITGSEYDVEVSPPRTYAETSLTTEERQCPLENPLEEMDVVKANYDEAFSQIVEAFPRCDFTDVVRPWERCLYMLVFAISCQAITRDGGFGGKWYSTESRTVLRLVCVKLLGSASAQIGLNSHQ